MRFGGTAADLLPGALDAALDHCVDNPLPAYSLGGNAPLGEQHAQTPF
jgi:hypothetical protein